MVLQVRYDRRMGKDTALKFMTDGILLREVQEDFLLSKYNVVVIDEAHERSLNTDVLLGMLSRVVALRRSMYDKSVSEGSNGVVAPLKLIIMSATLRVEDFVKNKQLFTCPPPVVQVPARQYPVAVHFQKKTELDDYVGAAFKKTCQIHKSLPEGGILVFLTGQREVEHLCFKLRKTFSSHGKMPSLEPQSVISNGKNVEEIGFDFEEDDIRDDSGTESDSEEDDDYDSIDENEEESEFVVLNGARNEENLQALNLEERVLTDSELKKIWVLPLYSMLRPELQAKVFKGAPNGHRLIVVATNVAETSLTIPGIRYVVDAGRSKQRILESNAGLAKYDIRWISKASAEQRAGRAGRMGPGHCYRLFSSAVFNDMFPTFSPPEIRNVPLEGLVLLLKSMGVHKVENFPYPSPPNIDDLRAAQKCLSALSAINKNDDTITELGKAMAKLPVSPRHSRLLIEVLWGGTSPSGSTRDSIWTKVRISKELCIAYSIRLAAAMSIESPFILPSSIHDSEQSDDTAAKDQLKEKLRMLRYAQKHFKVPDSDSLSSMKALCSFESSGGSDAFCKENFLVFKNLREGLKLTKQLEKIIMSSIPRDNAQEIPKLPTKLKFKTEFCVMDALKKAIAAGWGDRIARRVRSMEYLKRKQESASRSKAVRYESLYLDEDIFLHPNSSLYSMAPDWVVYSEVVRTAKRPYMIGVTAIEPQWIPQASPNLCILSQPLADPKPIYNSSEDAVLAAHDVTIGPNSWQLPRVYLPHPDKKERCAIFGWALLEGKAIPEMKQLRSAMVAPPSMISQPEMRVHRRVLELITELQRCDVDSVASLRAVWTDKNSEYLKPQVKDWVKKSAHKDVDRLWKILQT